MMPLLDKDRLFPKTEVTLRLARELYQNIAKLPIISPHGHCDPSWFSDNQRFPDPAQLFVVPDHYVFRMLVSQGFTLRELGVNSVDGNKLKKTREKYGKSSVKIIIFFAAHRRQCGWISLLKMFLE